MIGAICARMLDIRRASSAPRERLQGAAADVARPPPLYYARQPPQRATTGMPIFRDYAVNCRFAYVITLEAKTRRDIEEIFSVG